MRYIYKEQADFKIALKQNNYLLHEIIKVRKQLDSLNELSIRDKANKLAGIIIPKTFSNDNINVVFSECKKYDIPPRIAFRLIQKESNFRKSAKSSAGAKGYMQIMPVTYRGYAKKLNITTHDDKSNLKVGLFYLKTLYGYFDRRDYLSNDEKWRLTVLSYNYGISRVGKNKERFLGPEFKNYKYVNFILS
jgi:soluble lytic murein transglycosylase-like protein